MLLKSVTLFKEADASWLSGKIPFVGLSRKDRIKLTGTKKVADVLPVVMIANGKKLMGLSTSQNADLVETDFTFVNEQAKKQLKLKQGDSVVIDVAESDEIVKIFQTIDGLKAGQKFEWLKPEMLN